MKTFLRILLIAVMCISCSVVWAGGEINNSNLTSGFMRDLTRSTEADPIYNPAGLAFENRNFVTVGVQGIFKDYCSGNPAGCADDTSLVPDLSLHYRYDDMLSFVGAYYIVAGGGKLSFEKGNMATQTIAKAIGGNYSWPQYIDVESVYHALKAGIVYKVDPNIGISAGILQVFAEKSVEGEIKLLSGATAVKIELDQSASGMTGFASLHYSPSDLWDFSVNFTGPVRLSWDADKRNDANNFTKSSTVEEDLPAAFSMGAKRNITTDNGIFELKSGITYFLQDDFGVVWDDTFAKGAIDDRQKTYGNAYEISLTGTWELKNSPYKFYASYLYSNPRADLKTTSSFKPSLISNTIALGLDYKMNESTVLNCGVAKTFYEKEKVSKAAGEFILDRDTQSVGIGLQYYF